MYLCIYVYIYLCICAYMYICIYVYVYTFIYVYMYVCLYVYMYTCINMCASNMYGNPTYMQVIYMQCVVVQCSVLQSSAVCCGVLRYVAVYCCCGACTTSKNQWATHIYTYARIYVHVHINACFQHVRKSTHMYTFPLRFTRIYTYMYICTYAYVCEFQTYTETLTYVYVFTLGLFCRISSLSQGSFAKETYNFIDPTNQSHPICVTH